MKRGENSALILSDVFRKAEARGFRTKPCIIAGRRISYGDAVERMGKLTRLYRGAGLVPGDRIVVSTRDGAAAALFFLSFFANGLTAVCLDPREPEDRIARLMLQTSPRGAVFDASSRKRWTSFRPDFMLPIDDARSGPGTLVSRLFGREAAEAAYPEILKGLDRAELPTEIAEDLCACILFAGTAGDRAGARVSRKELFSRVRDLSETLGYDAESRIVNLLPCAQGGVFHALAAFVSGAALILPPRLEEGGPTRVLDAAYAERATHVVATPETLSLIVLNSAGRTDAFRSETFRAVVSSGGRLEPAAREALADRFQVRVVELPPDDALGGDEGRKAPLTPGPRTSFCSADELARRIIALAAPCFRMRPDGLTLESGVKDTAGWDSFAHLELITALETQFRISLSPAEVLKIKRLSDAWQIVHEKQRTEKGGKR